MKEKPACQFLIHEVLPQGDMVEVTGRSVGEGTIKLGDTFTAAYKIRIIKELKDDEVVSKSSELYDRCQVNLRVAEIYLYGHIMDELDPAMTARLTLQGDSLDCLGEGINLVIES